MTRMARGACILVPSVILFFKVHAFSLLSGAALHVQQRGIRTTRSRPAASLAREWTMGRNSFRTEVDVPLWPEHTQLGYADSFFLIGSCFSDNIDKRLARAKLTTSLNPAHGAWPVSSREGCDSAVDRRSRLVCCCRVIYASSADVGAWPATASHTSIYFQPYILSRVCRQYEMHHVRNVSLLLPR